ncbi:MAG: hypothetical protein NTW86_09875, partial [Candidatus Sumerlaeota bacterium]|nr:hypothetical protein [Candidatus Sumerlaeota bacterium]
TRTMAWSGPIRVASILFTLVALAQLGVAGATLGAVALFVGFVAEAGTIGFFLRKIRGLSISGTPSGGR